MQIFEGLPYIEIQLNQVRLKLAKWTTEIEHTFLKKKLKKSDKLILKV